MSQLKEGRSFDSPYWRSEQKSVCAQSKF